MLYEEIGEAILNQDYKPSDRSIISRYEKLTQEEKDKIDDIFISLSGYSLKTMIET